MTVNVPVGVLDTVNNILSIVEYPNIRNPLQALFP